MAPVLLGGEVAVAETPFVHDMFSTTCVSPVCRCIIAVVGKVDSSSFLIIIPTKISLRDYPFFLLFF